MTQLKSHEAPIIRSPEAGERRWFFGGGVHVWKVSAADSGGAFLLFEDELVRGKCTPWHRHAEVDETLYLIEGEIAVHHDGREHTVGAGGVVVFPRGVPHAFRVTSERARLLCMVTPGTAEAFYRDASEPLATSSNAVDFVRVQEAARQSGATEILGPPPFGR